MSEEERTAINKSLVNRIASLRNMYKDVAEQDKNEVLIEKIKGWDDWRTLDSESKSFLKETLGEEFKEVHLSNLLGEMTRQDLNRISSNHRSAKKSDLNSGQCCLHCKFFYHYIPTNGINKYLHQVCFYHQLQNVPEKPGDYDDAQLIGIYRSKQHNLCDHFSYALPVSNR